MEQSKDIVWRNHSSHASVIYNKALSFLAQWLNAQLPNLNSPAIGTMSHVQHFVVKCVERHQIHCLEAEEWPKKHGHQKTTATLPWARDGNGPVWLVITHSQNRGPEPAAELLKSVRIVSGSGPVWVSCGFLCNFALETSNQIHGNWELGIGDKWFFERSSINSDWCHGVIFSTPRGARYPDSMRRHDELYSVLTGRGKRSPVEWSGSSVASNKSHIHDLNFKKEEEEDENDAHLGNTIGESSGGGGGGGGEIVGRSLRVTMTRSHLSKLRKFFNVALAIMTGRVSSGTYSDDDVDHGYSVVYRDCTRSVSVLEVPWLLVEPVSHEIPHRSWGILV
ncbi:hypothetical protein LguiA_029780 [Lonicera macranthoides]